MTGISHAGDAKGAAQAAELQNPLERLRLLAGDEDAIASFLDELDVSSPREREMLAELARKGRARSPGAVRRRPPPGDRSAREPPRS